MCSFLSTLLHTSFLVQGDFGDNCYLRSTSINCTFHPTVCSNSSFLGGFGTLNSMEIEPVTSLPEIRGSNYCTLQPRSPGIIQVALATWQLKSPGITQLKL